MADYTDSYGSWIDLGTLQPTDNNWLQYPRDIGGFGGQDGLTFRFVFRVPSNDWEAWYNGTAGLRSYGLFTFAYLDDQSNFNYADQQTIRLYPQPQNLLLEKQTFAEFYSNPYIRRRGQIKRILTGRGSKYYNINTGQVGYTRNIAPWTLQIYYLII